MFGRKLFSLAQMTKIDEQGAVFRSHIDGELFELTPERAVAIQESLGTDVAMVAIPRSAPVVSVDTRLSQRTGKLFAVERVAVGLLVNQCHEVILHVTADCLGDQRRRVLLTQARE